MANMQFWGVEVKGNKPYKVKVEEGHLIHLSQAALGELKKDSEPVTVHVNVDNKKLVLGILNGGNNPQLAFDLVFDTDFEISHNWKNGSIHLLGYQSEMPDEDEDLSDFSDDAEEDVPIPQKENGKPSAVTIAAPKAAATAAKANKDNKAKPAEDSEDESDDSDEEDSDDDSEGPEDMSMGDASDDDDDDSEDEDDESSDEEPAKPAESGKKRPNKDEPKTPQSVKKAKVGTPQKTDGKKGGHEATPHPSKKGGKTPGNEKSPKSASQVSCGSCKKTFNSEVALQSHNKAKHAAK